MATGKKKSKKKAGSKGRAEQRRRRLRQWTILGAGVLVVGIAVGLVLWLDRPTPTPDVPDPDPTPSLLQPQPAADTGVGAVAPDFTLESLDGVPVTLSALRGRPVFLYFWESTCPECARAMVRVAEQQELYADHDLLFVGITSDRSAEAASAYLEDKGYEGWLTLYGSFDEAMDVVRLFEVDKTWIPHAILIDAEGVIRARGGLATWPDTEDIEPLLPSDAPSPDENPSEEKVHDFGAVTDGIKVIHPFVLTNTSDRTLSFPRAPHVPDLCPCTSVDPLPQDALEPGASMEIVVRFDSTGYGGQHVEELVEVYTDDPALPVRTLVLAGEVLPREPHEDAAANLYKYEFHVLVDLRSPEAYTEGHLLGAVSLPLDEIESWLPELHADLFYLLYDETGEGAALARQKLRDAGLRGAQAIAGGLAGWWAAYGDTLVRWAPGADRAAPEGQPVTAGATYDVSRLAADYIVALDLRPREDFAAGHLPGSVHLDPDEARAWIETHVPRDPPEGVRPRIWLVDADGSISPDVAKALREEGYDAVGMLGGLAEWTVRYGTRHFWPHP